VISYDGTGGGCGGCSGFGGLHQWRWLLISCAPQHFALGRLAFRRVPRVNIIGFAVHHGLPVGNARHRYVVALARLHTIIVVPLVGGINKRSLVNNSGSGVSRCLDIQATPM